MNKSQPMIKNIIFDIGNVLLTWSPESIIAKAFPDRKFDCTLAERIFSSHIWSDLDRGKMSLSEAIKQYQNYLGFPISEFKNFRQAIFESYLPIEGSLELLADLEVLNFNLYSITDCITETYDFLIDKYTFFDKFLDVAVSAHFGSTKPDLAIYYHLCNRNNILPSETVFIDDKLQNIEVAKSCGMHIVHFRDSNSCRNKLNALLGRAI